MKIIQIKCCNACPYQKTHRITYRGELQTDVYCSISTAVVFIGTQEGMEFPRGCPLPEAPA